MKDHKAHCLVTQSHICTCGTEHEVQATYWEAKHHRQVVISWVLFFWFVLAAFFNILFVIDIWFME